MHNALAACRPAWALLFCFAIDSAAAFTFQGELSQDAALTEATCDFSAALFDQPEAGNPLAEPVFAPGLPVVRGRFTLEVTNWPDTAAEGEHWLELAVGCPSGAPLVTVLPRKPIAVAPSASMVQGAAAGSVDTTALAPAAVTTTRLSPGAVTGLQVTAGAVTTDRIASGAVAADDIAPGAVGSDALAHQAVTADRIMPGSVNATTVDSSAVQLRVAAECAADTAIHAIDASGQVACAPLVAGTIDAAKITSGRLSTERLSSGGEWPLDADLFGASHRLKVRNIAGLSDLVLETPNGSVAPGRISAMPITAGTALLQAENDNVLLFNLNAGGQLLLGGQRAGFPDDLLAVGAYASFWQPQVSAFRTGGASGTQWHAPNLGNYSLGIGQDNTAFGDYSSALGNNTRAGHASLAAGNSVNAAGTAAVALGGYGSARPGSFVFGDRSVTLGSVPSLVPVNNAAGWRLVGGFRIHTASDLSSGVTIQSGTTVSNWGHDGAVISTSNGARLSTGGVWENAGEGRAKHNALPVDGEEMLQRLAAIPIQTWRYLDDPADVRHIGPTSQDFMATFGFGHDVRSIGTLDADSVVLAALQALAHRDATQRDAVDALQSGTADALRRLENLEKRLHR